MITSKDPTNKGRKLKSCLPGTLIKFQNGILGIVLGPVEGSNIHLYVRYQSGSRGMEEKGQVVDQLLDRDSVYVLFLRLLTTVEEI
jgi:hypothetical protein